jgi:hypothetical protein
MANYLRPTEESRSSFRAVAKDIVQDQNPGNAVRNALRDQGVYDFSRKDMTYLKKLETDRRKLVIDPTDENTLSLSDRYVQAILDTRAKASSKVNFLLYLSQLKDDSDNSVLIKAGFSKEIVTFLSNFQSYQEITADNVDDFETLFDFFLQNPSDKLMISSSDGTPVLSDAFQKAYEEVREIDDEYDVQLRRALRDVVSGSALSRDAQRLLLTNENLVNIDDSLAGREESRGGKLITNFRDRYVNPFIISLDNYVKNKNNLDEDEKEHILADTRKILRNLIKTVKPDDVVLYFNKIKEDLIRLNCKDFVDNYFQGDTIPGENEASNFISGQNAVFEDKLRRKLNLFSGVLNVADTKPLFAQFFQYFEKVFFNEQSGSLYSETIPFYEQLLQDQYVRFATQIANVPSSKDNVERQKSTYQQIISSFLQELVQLYDVNYEDEESLSVEDQLRLNKFKGVQKLVGSLESKLIDLDPTYDKRILIEGRILGKLYSRSEADFAHFNSISTELGDRGLSNIITNLESSFAFNYSCGLVISWLKRYLIDNNMSSYTDNELIFNRPEYFLTHLKKVIRSHLIILKQSLKNSSIHNKDEKKAIEDLLRLSDTKFIDGYASLALKIMAVTGDYQLGLSLTKHSWDERNTRGWEQSSNALHYIDGMIRKTSGPHAEFTLKQPKKSLTLKDEKGKTVRGKDGKPIYLSTSDPRLTDNQKKWLQTTTGKLMTGGHNPSYAIKEYNKYGKGDRIQHIFDNFTQEAENTIAKIANDIRMQSFFTAASGPGNKDGELFTAVEKNFEKEFEQRITTELDKNDNADTSLIKRLDQFKWSNWDARLQLLGATSGWLFIKDRVGNLKKKSGFSEFHEHNEDKYFEEKAFGKVYCRMHWGDVPLDEKVANKESDLLSLEYWQEDIDDELEHFASGENWKRMFYKNPLDIMHNLSILAPEIKNQYITTKKGRKIDIKAHEYIFNSPAEFKSLMDSLGLNKDDTAVVVKERERLQKILSERFGEGGFKKLELFSNFFQGYYQDHFAQKSSEFTDAVDAYALEEKMNSNHKKLFDVDYKFHGDLREQYYKKQGDLLFDILTEAKFKLNIRESLATSNGKILNEQERKITLNDLEYVAYNFDTKEKMKDFNLTRYCELTERTGYEVLERDYATYVLRKKMFGRNGLMVNKRLLDEDVTTVKMMDVTKEGGKDCINIEMGSKGFFYGISKEWDRQNGKVPPSMNDLQYSYFFKDLHEYHGENGLKYVWDENMKYKDGILKSLIELPDKLTDWQRGKMKVGDVVTYIKGIVDPFKKMGDKRLQQRTAYRLLEIFIYTRLHNTRLRLPVIFEPIAYKGLGAFGGIFEDSEALWAKNINLAADKNVETETYSVISSSDVHKLLEDAVSAKIIHPSKADGRYNRERMLEEFGLDFTNEIYKNTVPNQFFASVFGVGATFGKMIWDGFKEEMLGVKPTKK